MVRRRPLTRSVNFYLRNAFTMIELIFAIVVLAVVMLTIPMMIQANNKSLEGNVAQEAIFLVSAVLSATTTLVWDNRSLVGGDTGYSLAKVLDVPTGDPAYRRWNQLTNTVDVNSTIRKGGLDEDLHRSYFDYNVSDTDQYEPASSDAYKEPLPDSIGGDTSSFAGFKFDYTIEGTREYVDDTPNDPFIFTVPTALVAKSNIKMTEIRIDANTTEFGVIPIAKLRAYTCNIGEIDYAKRRF